MKVLYFNNVPTELLWREWEQGVSPSHHLWGVPGLRAAGLEVDVLPYEGRAWLKRLSKSVRLLGDLDQQFRVLRVASQYDVLYCGCQHDALLIGLLRFLGLVKVPTVVTMHHMVNPLFRSQWMFKLFFGSITSFVCLHQRVAKELTGTFCISPDRVEVIEWGGDADFYAKAAQGEGTPANGQPAAGVVAAGRTFRDYGVLIRAVRGSDIPLHIFCTQDVYPTEPTSPNIAIHAQAKLSTLKTLLGHYQRAAVVAIPMVDLPDKLIGLTSLIDAMAMGKPVVMTRNAHIDIDIEKEGIGIWVAPGDEAGWKRALTHLLSHPQEAQAMGQRALALVQGKYHIDRFSAQLAGHLRQVHTRAAR